MKTAHSNIFRGSMASLVIGSLAVVGAFTAKGGKPAKPPKDDGALKIPVCITIDNREGDAITSHPLGDAIYYDGVDRVAAWLGGNVHPEQILFDTSTGNKTGSGRQLSFDLLEFPEIGVTEAEFQTEWDVDFQGMAVGDTKTISARFVIPKINDKNQYRLMYDAVSVRACDQDEDGVTDSWLISADGDNADAYVIQYVRWAPQPDVDVVAPFAILVEKME